MRWHTHAATVECGRIEMDDAQCLRHLQSSHIGRLLGADGSEMGLEIVHYTMIDDDFYFYAAGQSRLAASTVDGAVALEVDRLNDATGAGWVVIVRGMAEAWRSPVPAGIDALLARPTNTPEHQCRLIRLHPSSITGRQFGKPPSAWSAVAELASNP